MKEMKTKFPTFIHYTYTFIHRFVVGTSKLIAGIVIV